MSKLKHVLNKSLDFARYAWNNNSITFKEYTEFQDDVNSFIVIPPLEEQMKMFESDCKKNNLFMIFTKDAYGCYYYSNAILAFKSYQIVKGFV